MSTKTMRAPPRRVPHPLGVGDSSGSKRKQRDHDPSRPKSKPLAPLRPEPSQKGPNPMPSNMLLAGYLAHQFLTKGTLLGPSEEESPQQKHERYVEVSLLLKTKGPNLCHIVNPTQLAHFFKL
ncbi:hypothetical protein VNO78_17467 [Psophocarpus tetragonolobus]|uniref:Uncharacterized protein n=1 Tax=Psophocarpus tetragonolobus TaxID=3891 RepID=A0AAN9XL29_PSOTE